MQKSAALQIDVEYILFELNRCINNLQDYQLQLSLNEIQQTELSLHKLQTLTSFAKSFSQRKVAC